MDGSRIERAASGAWTARCCASYRTAWDPALAGVIDPTLEWSTYLGGGPGGMGNDYATDIAVDAAGNTYLTGTTGSADFPTTTGALDATLELPRDTFVTKVDATGSALVFSTLIAGTGEQGADGAVAVDGTGNVFLTGGLDAASADFPATPGAYDATPNGVVEPFVMKLDAGGALAYATALGGNGGVGADIAVDGDGAAYVVGTAGSGHPTTPGAFDTSANGGDRRVRHEAQPGRERPRVQHAARRRGRGRRGRHRPRRRRSRVHHRDLSNPAVHPLPEDRGRLRHHLQRR